MIAFKTYRDCPLEQLPPNTSLDWPWMVQAIDSEKESLELQSLGFKVIPEEDFEKYKLSIAPQLRVEAIIDESIEFGAALLTEFSAENVLLGITQLGKTGEVLVKLQGVMSAIIAGSLYEAISRIRAIPITDHDGRFITPARLLIFINKIEAYLGLPLSTSL